MSLCERTYAKQTSFIPVSHFVIALILLVFVYHVIRECPTQCLKQILLFKVDVNGTNLPVVPTSLKHFVLNWYCSQKWNWVILIIFTLVIAAIKNTIALLLLGLRILFKTFLIICSMGLNGKNKCIVIKSPGPVQLLTTDEHRTAAPRIMKEAWQRKSAA